jgi:hypothetical protein
MLPIRIIFFLVRQIFELVLCNQWEFQETDKGYAGGGWGLAREVILKKIISCGVWLFIFFYRKNLIMGKYWEGGNSNNYSNGRSMNIVLGST